MIKDVERIIHFSDSEPKIWYTKIGEKGVVTVEGFKGMLEYRQFLKSHMLADLKINGCINTVEVEPGIWDNMYPESSFIQRIRSNLGKKLLQFEYRLSEQETIESYFGPIKNR